MPANRGMGMRLFKLIALLVVLLPTLVVAQQKAKKHPDLPAVFANARYVYVEAIGGDAFNPGLYPKDRQAIVDVEDALRDWNRYTLTVERKQADLVFVVRKGRLASGQIRGTVGSSPPPHGTQPPGRTPLETGVDLETEVGPEDDLLWVCLIHTDGKRSGPIWRLTLPDGLDGPQLLLFQQLKAAVERAYPRRPVSQPSKP